MRPIRAAILHVGLLCSLAPTHAMAAAAYAWDLAACTPVCMAPGEQQSAAISASAGGILVVWQDGRPDGKAPGTEHPWSVYGRYLTQSKDFPIHVPPDANAISPAVSGNTVVWIHNRGWSSLMMTTLKDGLPGELRGIEGTASNPAIDGNLVVWASSKHRYDAGKGNIGWITDIRAFEIAGPGVAFDVAASEIVPQTAPAVNGTTVAWGELRHGSSSYNSGFIQYRNIDKDPGAQRVAGTANKMATHPAVQGALIVWQDNRSGDWDILGLDIKTGNERVIYSGAGDQVEPAMYGSVVVWQDNRHGDWDIYGCETSTGETFPLYAGPGNQTDPAICADVVVWTDDRNGNNDIYMSRGMRQTNEQKPERAESR